MIVHIVLVLIFRVLVEQSFKLSVAEAQVVQLVLENHARLIQTFHDDAVAGFHLFLGERQLSQIVLAFVRVVLCAVFALCQRVLYRLLACYAVLHLLCQFLLLVCVEVAHHSLVHSLPVVHVFATAPQLLECGLTLAHRHGVVEVPLSLAVGVDVFCVIWVWLPFAVAAVLRHDLSRLLLLFLLLLFLLLFLQSLYHPVDGGIAFFLACLCQVLQRVLQVYGLGVRHQFVEHHRAA